MTERANASHFARQLLLDAYMSLREGEEEDPSIIYVSEVASCLRRSYLRRLVKVPPLTLVYAAIGDMFHKYLERALHRRGFAVEVPVSVEVDGLVIKGRADAWNPREKIVVEIKTTNYRLRDPLPWHVMQANAYAHMLGAEKIMILYYPRSGILEPYGFELEPDPRAWDKFLDRARRLSYYLRSNILPPQEPSPMCKYCEFQLECWFNGKVKRVDELVLPSPSGASGEAVKDSGG